MQPNGKIPPIMIPGNGLVYNDCSGICLGIWLVRTGFSINCRLNPKYEPRNTNGVLTQNHNANNASKVKNGIAAELELTHKTKFSMKNMMKTIPGHKNAVNKTFFIHFSPPNILYKRADT